MIRDRQRLLNRAAFATLLAASALFTGCASFYVDNGLQRADTEQVTKPAAPKPVQLFFSFQTKGAPNPQATQLLRAQVHDQVKQSGLFSEIKDTAGTDTGVLQLTINNVPLTTDAAAKGALTGLTLGLVGSTVGDGYVCEMTYKRSDDSPAIKAVANHAIYTSLGAGSSPEAAATKVASANDAITTVVRQAVQTLLVKLSNDPQLRSAP